MSWNFCNLDPVNMCCWTHGIDIDVADYTEGYCAIGVMEAEEEEDEPIDDWDEIGRDT